MAHWICASWISTVILGVPILAAALGPQYANLGILAGVSSFIFQLPVMLLLLELHWSSSSSTASCAKISTPLDAEAAQSTHDASPRLRVRWALLGHRLLHNHVLWAIALGLVLSLSTVGWKYLDPTSKQYIAELGFFAAWLELLGRTAEPLALFATGTFFAAQLSNTWRSDAGATITHNRSSLWGRMLRLIAYMTAKLVLMPLLAIGCAMVVDLDGVYGRAMVLLAVLPISPAAFALCSEYQVRADDVGWNVAAGTLLMLPASIAWQASMDAIGLFAA